jgi:XTP/dITP diphosphohydrolase
MTRIVLASGNKGKLREFSAMFSEHFANDNVELIPQTELDVSDADETGLSFVENAIIKARHACQVTGLPALADDSGIEIDALDGAPGIYSARYSGEGDQANNAKVLENMKGIPEAQRTARFQCVLVYMRHAEDPTPQVFQGAWEGIILTEPSGTEGFGYDPIFYVPSEQCSAAELSRERKNNLSHRGQAIQQLLARWHP